MYKIPFALGLSLIGLVGCVGNDYVWLSDPDIELYENHRGAAYRAELAGTIGAEVSFRIEGEDAELFTTNTQTGEIQFKQSPNYEAPKDFMRDNRYRITVIGEDANSGERLSALNVSITIIDAEQIKAAQLFPLPNSYVESNSQGVVPLTVVFDGNDALTLNPDYWQIFDPDITHLFEYNFFGINPSYNEDALSVYLDANQYDHIDYQWVPGYYESVQAYFERSFSNNFHQTSLLQYGYTVNPSNNITATYSNNTSEQVSPLEMEWQLKDQLNDQVTSFNDRPQQIALSESMVYLASDNVLWQMTREGKQLAPVYNEQNSAIVKLSVLSERVFMVVHEQLSQRWYLKELLGNGEIIDVYELVGFNALMIGADFDVEILYENSGYVVIFLPKDLCATNSEGAIEPALYRFDTTGFTLDKSLLTNSSEALFNCQNGYIVDQNLSVDLEYSSPKLSYNYKENTVYYWGRSYSEDDINGLAFTGASSSITIGTEYWFDESADSVSEFQHFSKHFEQRKSFYVKGGGLYVVNGHINGDATRISSENYQVQTYAVDASANLIYSIGLWGDTQTPAMAAHHFYSGAASYIPLISTH